MEKDFAMGVPEQRGRPPSAFAPKGRNTRAQGNALGTEPMAKSVALKGQDDSRAEPGFRPFRASAMLPTRFPRSLPWALLFCPFGAEEGRQGSVSRSSIEFCTASSNESTFASWHKAEVNSEREPRRLLPRSLVLVPFATGAFPCTLS